MGRTRAELGQNSPCLQSFTNDTILWHRRTIQYERQKQEILSQNFRAYPDMVTLLQFREMLSGVSDNFARKLIHEKHVKSIFIKPHYYISKNSVIDYVLSEDICKKKSEGSCMREYFIDGIPYISKEQFCKLAHVRKANVLKLIQSGLIPYIDIGNQTHRYLIRQSDVEVYLTDRAHDPAKYSFQRKSRIQTYPGKFDRNFANELSQYASVLWKDEPQVLTVQQVHDLLGYSEHVIRRWYTTCGLAVVRLGTRTYIPKKGLLRFIGSRSFHSIKEKSAAHVDLIRSVDYEGA